MVSDLAVPQCGQVMTDANIMIASRAGRDVRTSRKSIPCKMGGISRIGTGSRYSVDRRCGVVKHDRRSLTFVVHLRGLHAIHALDRLMHYERQASQSMFPTASLTVRSVADAVPVPSTVKIASTINLRIRFSFALIKCRRALRQCAGPVVRKE